MFSSIDRYDDPAFPWGAAVEQMSREVRVVVWDGHGTGLSDPVTRAPALDDRVRDLHGGARIGAIAASDEVLASRTVRDLTAGSGLVFESLGPQRLKGLPEEVDVYRLR